MAERNNCRPGNLTEAVCIDVNRVYDQCRDRDCARDARVYINPADQEVLNSAVSVKPVSAEILYALPDIEPLPFNRGFYTVDTRFFVLVTCDCFTGINTPTRITGLSVFDKKAILFGSEGSAKIYSSEYQSEDNDTLLGLGSNTPVATVETLDPILLSAKAVPVCEPCGCCSCDLASVPTTITRRLGGLADPETGNDLYATFGFFTVIRLMRRVQIVVPGCDFCIPEKECCGPTEEDPCSLFERMEFPLDEFFPPKVPDCDCNRQ